MLTDLRSILALAEEKGCAIPAFNCYTQECVMGVLEAAKETGAPVIFQMFSRLADTNDGNFVAPAILEAIRQLPQPAVMHLDHGAGIPEEELPFVKQKFYKGSSKARGSGIGLAVCDEIVRLHGGTFDIANAEGGGAVVTISLPMS